MRPTDVARILAVSRAQVHRMAADGRLPCFRIGTSLRFDPGTVADWLQSKLPA
jgi:excisionase family DNA binding protein